MNRSHAKGFTLVELMITLGLAAILMAVAIPNMRDYMRNSRLTGAVNDVLHSLQVARTEAIKRQQGNVVVCGTANPNVAAPVCDYTNFNGWIVFQDLDNNWQVNGADVVIERHGIVDPSLTVKTDATDRIISFGPSGFENPNGVRLNTRTIVVCDARGIAAIGTGSTARTVLITQTGRARASSVWSDVNGLAKPTLVGGNCP
jgi:type IV fimbrial biogenesis protein FimT